MTSTKVKIGIVGIGGMGSVHARHVVELEQTELIAVCDSDDTRLNTISDQYEIDTYKDYQTMLDSVELDGVIIATPHFSHPPLAIAAFEKGIHVLVEKPIAVHVRDAQTMITAYDEAKKQFPNLAFSAMFNQRTYGHWRKIKEMIDQGDLGQLIRTTWIITNWFRTQAYYDSGDWRATWRGEGGGVLINQCPHNLDLYQWLVGMPTRIHGFASFGKHHNIEVEDEATGYFEHDNGMIGHFITTTGESPGTNRLEIVGENGKLVYENDELIFYRNRWSSIKQIKEATGGFDRVEYERVLVPYEPIGTGGHDLMINNFADAIQNGNELIAPAVDGIHSVMINNGIILSAHKKQTIDMPFDGDEYVQLLQHYIEEAAK